MARKQIFRQASLDRLATPERLDRALFTTTPKGWLAILALLLIAAATVAWSIGGEVSTYVQAEGILLNRGGKVVDAVSSGVGTLTRIIAAVGQTVEKGDVVAEVANAEALERYRSALALVEERAAELEDFRSASAEEDAIIERNVVRRRAHLERLEGSDRQALEVGRKRLESYLRLFERGVIDQVTVENSQQDYDELQRALFATLRERDDLEASEVKRKNDRKTRLNEMKARLEAAQRGARELEALLGTQRILAPVSGRVTEIKASIGGWLEEGFSVLSINTGAKPPGGAGATPLEALVYIPPDDGKQVERGMEALVSPSTVRREEYGSIKGRVESVSTLPVSMGGMVAVLQNRSLAERLSRGGPPYAGRIALLSDPETASGFAWTSPKASDQSLSSGTLASVEIKVGSQAPITLVVPLLKELFGL